MKIKWSPRLVKSKLTRLYQLNALQIIDHDLLQEVALTLYMRCKDIIAVYDAHYNFRVRCPGCHASGNERYLELPKTLKRSERDPYVFVCHVCGCAFSWHEFRKSHSRRQMNIGGAGDVFRRYIAEYERKLGDNDLMLAVDRLIHEFHYGLQKDGSVQEGRIVACNLIDIESMEDTIRFLDGLSNGESSQVWREKISRYWECK